MSLEKYTTTQTEQIQFLAQTLAKQELLAIGQLEPIADFEELLTFDEAQSTPIEFTPQYPAWRLESVAARIIEAVAIAAHEPLSASEYRDLARILLAHAEYLYAYPDGDPRPRLEAGSALALASSVCASLPQSELWRLAGFGRISAVLADVAPAPTDSHLTLPIDVAFSLANERNLPILASAVTTYNTVLKRNLIPTNQYNLPFSDNDFFDALNLDYPGMEAVKSALFGEACEFPKLAVKSAENIPTAKSAYTDFRSQFIEDFVGGICNPDAVLLEKSDTYTTAKTYLECLLRLSIHPTPAITATTEMGIAAHLFPEFRGSEQLRMLTLRRYKWIVDAFFHSDGFHKDRTLRSQIEAIADFARFLRFQSDSQTDALRTLLEKLVATCMHLRQPDNTFPPLGPLLTPNFDADELCTIVNSSFRREDFPLAHTTSHALPETGCYVMRDSWEPDAQYLFFDAHPPGKPSHADSSTLVLYAHGRHLTIGAVRVLDAPLSASDRIDTQWTTTPVFDFVEKWHHTTTVHHKRAIFYLKGEYFILHDLVLGDSAQTLEQIFRLGQRAAPHIVSDAGDIRTQDPRRSNLFIGALDATDLSVTLDGETATYRRHQESPVVMNTLLFPMKPEVNVHPTLSDITVRTDPDVLGTGFTLQSHNTTDTFLISDDGLAEMSTADIRFVGEYLFLRRDASGSEVQFVMLNGRFLEVGQNVLADFDEACENYVRM
jgi:hypothetical protein